MQKQNLKAQINEIVKLVPAQLTSFTVFNWTYPFSLILDHYRYKYSRTWRVSEVANHWLSGTHEHDPLCGLWEAP